VVSNLAGPAHATERVFLPQHPSLPLRFYEAPTEWLRGLRADVANMLYHKSVRVAFTYAVIARALDVLATIAGVHRGVRELNPASRFVLGSWGLGGFATEQVVIVVLLILGLARMRHRHARMGFWVATALALAAVTWNLVG